MSLFLCCILDKTMIAFYSDNGGVSWGGVDSDTEGLHKVHKSPASGPTCTGRQPATFRFAPARPACTKAARARLYLEKESPFQGTATVEVILH